MKRFLFWTAAVVLLLLVSGSKAQAQDIYNTILSDARATADNTEANIVVRKIATFKRDDLCYIRQKAVEVLEEVSYKFLDDQAYYLNLFIQSFIQDVLLNENLTQSEKKKKIQLYIDATGSNPLFYDSDRELVNAYVNDSKNQYTPFCLDTNWIKAFEAVKSQE